MSSLEDHIAEQDAITAKWEAARRTPRRPSLPYFTVLLMLPDDMRGDMATEADWVDFTYCCADDAKDAVEIIRASFSDLYGAEADPDDFTIIAVLRGWHTKEPL
jgi:hypothetical protein